MFVVRNSIQFVIRRIGERVVKVKNVRYNAPVPEDSGVGEREEVESSSKLKAILRTFGEFLRLTLIAAAIAIPIRYFIAQPFIVRGASMEPNYHDREYLVIDELSYFFREPRRGEVVVFHYPVNPREYFIKRIIGLPGETVEIREEGIVIFNTERPEGFTLTEPYLPPGAWERGSSRFTLGPKHFVVLGDNRVFSSDSRTWGALEQKYITGRAVFRAWPIARFGVLPQP